MSFFLSEHDKMGTITLNESKTDLVQSNSNTDLKLLKGLTSLATNWKF